MIEAKEVQIVTKSVLMPKKPYTGNKKNNNEFANNRRKTNMLNPLSSKAYVKKSTEMESRRSS
jgi:hypothetical protein